MMYVLLIVGFILLIKGADYFVIGSSAIAHLLKVPSVIVGLTIVAMGTSAPEAAVSITAGLAGSNELALSNVIGSNIFNLVLIVGICALIKPFHVESSIMKRDFPLAIIGSVILLLFVKDGSLSRIEGLLFLSLMVIYLLVTVFSAIRHPVEDGTESHTLPMHSCLFYIIIGLVGIIFGGDLVVDNACAIAAAFGLSETLIGLTIVAIGTSLPELVTSVTAARKGKADIAIGNIVGSNVFNILFVVGTTVLITPVAFKMGFLIDSAVALIAGLILWFGVMKDRKLKRPVGIIMLLAYAVYFVYLLMG